MTTCGYLDTRDFECTENCDCRPGDCAKKRPASTLGKLTAEEQENWGNPDYKPGDLPPPHPNDPKQGEGEKKIPFHALPFAVLAEDAVAHGEGALKYGRHNWREGEVLASTYFAAALRHLFAWFEGENVDPDSGLSHLTKARASLGVLRDAQIQGTAIDDRPRPSPEGLMADLNQASGDMARRVQSAKKGK